MANESGRCVINFQMFRFIFFTPSLRSKVRREKNFERQKINAAQGSTDVSLPLFIPNRTVQFQCKRHLPTLQVDLRV